MLAKMEFRISLLFLSPSPKNIQNSIHNTFIPSKPVKDDGMIWGATPNSLYSTKYAYQILDQGQETMIHNFAWIWKLKVPKKILSFFWLLFHERTPTGAYLHYVGYNQTPFNAARPMKHHHRFFKCTISHTFWQDIISLSNRKTNTHIPTFTSTYWPTTWASLKKKAYNNIITWEELLTLYF